MKLFFIVICVCFVKACQRSPFKCNDESYSSDIQVFRAELLQQPGMNRAHVDRFSEALEKLLTLKSTKDTKIDALFELLALAVQGDNPTNAPIDLKPALKFAKELPMNSEKMVKLVIEMMKVMTLKQAKHATHILAGMKGATEVEMEAAMEDLIISAMESLKKEARLHEARINEAI